MSGGFIHLHVSSSHSLHWGASSPSELVEFAKTHGMKSLAITDRDSLAGCVPFAKAALENGIKPIIGCELTEPSPPCRHGFQPSIDTSNPTCRVGFQPAISPDSPTCRHGFQPSVDTSNPTCRVGFQPAISPDSPTCRHGFQPAISPDSPTCRHGFQPSVDTSNPTCRHGFQPSVDTSNPTCRVGFQPANVGKFVRNPSEFSNQVVKPGTLHENMKATKIEKAVSLDSGFGTKLVSEEENRLEAHPTRGNSFETKFSESHRLEAYPTRGRSVILLARNRKGYEFISRVITARHLNDDFDFVDAISKADENVIILISDPELMEVVVKSGSTGITFAEIVASENDEYLKRNYVLSRTAEKLGVRTVLTCAAYGTAHKKWEVHKVLRAIALLTSINRLKEIDFMPSDCCMKLENELSRWQERFHGAIERTSEIADMCDYSPAFEKWVFPNYPVPTGDTDHEYLSRIAHDGLKRRVKNPTAEYRRRLMFELSTIKKLGFSSYFLAVWDIVQLTRSRQIPCIGRGSAANSLVAYCLWLTHVDPIKSDLFFERFLNPWRTSPPDIDIDFSWKRRDEIINWVYERFGRDRVAMISTHVTFRMRSAVREVAKAYGIPDEEALSVTDKIPWGWDGDPDTLVEHNPNARDLPFEQESWKQVLKIAGKIQGFPQHLSIHCGGIVITPDPITNHVPLQKSGLTGKGLTVTQFEMHAVEGIGLIKIDLLGNRSLGVFTDIMNTLRERGIEPDIDNQDMFFHDPDTIEMIKSGQTMGCFYIESPAMRNLLKKLHVVDFEGLTAASSVIRPGVAESGMMDEYIKRHNNPSETSYLHPKMKDILHKTYGVMIYQEDVIRVVNHIAGMTLAEADILRRAMSGKSRGHKSMREFEDEFVASCMEKDIDSDIACEIWRQVASFAGYSFCKGHSASFAILSFQMSYLKSHYPALFMASVMSNFGGFYGLGAYIEEARRIGCKIHPPDINKSNYLHCEIDGEIYLGFVIVKNLEQKIVEKIMSDRSKNGKFKSLYDFVKRTSITPSQIRILIECGACDSLGISRPKLLMQAEVYMQSRSTGKSEQSGDELFPSYDPSPRIRSDDDFSKNRRIEMEMRHFGRIVSCHPLDCFTDELKRMKIISSLDMMKYNGKRIKMAGWMIAHKTIRTRKNGKLMKFLSMEDLYGTFEVTMFPDSFEKHGWKTRTHGPYIITGKIELHFGVPSLTCECIDVLFDKIGSGRETVVNYPEEIGELVY
jgi:DNA-directed DNA polymerase III PolC